MAADRLAQAVAKYGKSGVARLLNAQGFTTSRGGAISERYIRDALTLRPGKTAAAQASARGGLNAMLRQVDFRRYPKAPRAGGAITAKPRGRFEPREQIVRGMKHRPPTSIFRVGEYDTVDQRGRTVRRIRQELTRKALLTLYVESGLPATLWRFAWFGEFLPAAFNFPGMLGGALDAPVYGVSADEDGDEDDDDDGEQQTLPTPRTGDQRPVLGWRRGFYGSTREAHSLPPLVREVDEEVQDAIEAELARQRAAGGPVQSRASVSHLMHMGRVNRKTGEYIPSWASRLVSKLTGLAWRRVTYADVSLAKGG